MTSDEIRAAMEWATWRQTSHVYAETLAAAVRELYEALTAIRAYAEHPVSQDDGYAITCYADAKLRRYRAALEGGDDE